MPLSSIYPLEEKSGAASEPGPSVSISAVCVFADWTVLGLLDAKQCFLSRSFRFLRLHGVARINVPAHRVRRLPARLALHCVNQHSRGRTTRRIGLVLIITLNDQLLFDDSLLRRVIGIEIVTVDVSSLLLPHYWGRL